jgi:predicted kinase
MADFTETRFDYSVGRADASELIVLVGVSGSGKSVYAKSQVNWGRGKIVRLNRDNLRAMMYCDVPWSSKNENLVRNFEQEAARMALQSGKDVIIDDTNCVRQTRYGWETFAQQCRVKLRIVTMTTDLKTCIERDSKREGKERVGEGVIRNQYKQLTEVKVSPKEQKVTVLTRPYFERQMLKDGGFTPRLPGCPWALVDIDGTVAKKGNRGQFDETKVLLDDVYEVVAAWVCALYPAYNICIVSGRHDFCGDDTCEWLSGNGIPFDKILMRYSGDNRSDVIVKKEILDELAAVVGKENIAFVLDDRPKVQRMWRENGIKVYPVRGTTEHKVDCDLSYGYQDGCCVRCGALEEF